MIPMSTVTEEGVMQVKTDACERLLAHRVEVKMKSKKMGEIINRLHVAMPKPRDTKERPAFIPEGAIKKGIELLCFSKQNVSNVLSSYRKQL